MCSHRIPQGKKMGDVEYTRLSASGCVDQLSDCLKEGDDVRNEMLLEISWLIASSGDLAELEKRAGMSSLTQGSDSIM